MIDWACASINNNIDTKVYWVGSMFSKTSKFPKHHCCYFGKHSWLSKACYTFREVDVVNFSLEYSFISNCPTKRQVLLHTVPWLWLPDWEITCVSPFLKSSRLCITWEWHLSCYTSKIPKHVTLVVVNSSR